MEASSEGARGKERHNMGRHTRMEAVISFLSNAGRHTIIIKKNYKEIYPTSEKTHPLRLRCSNEINVMTIRG